VCQKRFETKRTDRGFKSNLIATCPLGLQSAFRGASLFSDAYGMYLIGHDGHPEVEGTMGRYA